MLHFASQKAPKSYLLQTEVPTPRFPGSNRPSPGSQKLSTGYPQGYPRYSQVIHRLSTELSTGIHSIPAGYTHAVVCLWVIQSGAGDARRESKRGQERGACGYRIRTTQAQHTHTIHTTQAQHTHSIRLSRRAYHTSRATDRDTGGTSPITRSPSTV